MADLTRNQFSHELMTHQQSEKSTQTHVHADTYTRLSVRGWGYFQAEG